MNELRQRQTVRNLHDKGQRMADYVKSEIVLPEGRPSGSILRKADKQLGGIILSISQGIWFVSIAIGVLFYAGKLGHVAICLIVLHLLSASAPMLRLMNLYMRLAFHASLLHNR